MSSLSPAVGALRLTRPLNCVVTGLSVWVGALCSGNAHLTLPVALAALGAACIAAAGNAMNDVLDLREDRINRPDRPLPAGQLDVGPALILSSILGVGGLTAAFVAGVVPGFIAFCVLLGLAAYNWWLKRLGLVGNLLVALIAASTFPYGAAAAGFGGRWWIPALFAVLYHVGRELVKGVEDTQGDQLAGVRTMALVHGDMAASRLAAALLALVAVLAPLPVWFGIYDWAYLAIIVVLDVFLADCVLRLWRGRAVGEARLSRRLLAGMMIGLTAIVVGELF